MKEVDNSVVDLFHEELNKKQRKEAKKIARLKVKEKKKQLKQQKLLEQAEDIEFAKKIEKKYSEEFEVTNELLEIKKDQTTRTKLNEKRNIKKYPILNFFLGLSLIILFITSIDFLVFSILKEKDIELIITSSLLCILSLFYILSIITKKVGIKKLFEIIASIAITAYMCYQLFII